MNSAESEKLFKEELEEWLRMPIYKIIIGQFQGIVQFNLFKKFYMLICELMKPYESKEIEKLVNYYHTYYLRGFWSVFCSFWLMLFIIWFTIMSLIYDGNNHHIYMSLLQLPFLILYFSILDILVHKTRTFVNNVLVLYLIGASIPLCHQNAGLKEFKIDEIWMIVNTIFFAIGIVMSLDPVRIILAFLFVQSYYIALMHYTFGILPVHFYCGFVIFILFFWIIVWGVSKAMRDMIKLLQENEELAFTI